MFYRVLSVFWAQKIPERSFLWLRILAVLLWVCLENGSAQTLKFRVHRPEDANFVPDYTFLWQDHQGLMWLGSDGGLYGYCGTEYLHYDRRDSLAKKGTTATAMFQTTDNRYWVGFSDGFIGVIQGDSIAPWAVEEGHPRAKITGFAQDHLGQLWIATYGEGIYVFNGSRLYNFSGEDGLGGDEIYALLFEKTEKKVWIATDSGIDQCGFEAGKKTAKPLSGLADLIVQHLKHDHAGRIILGYEEKGIGIFDPKTKTLTQAFPGSNLGSLAAIASLSDGSMVISSKKEGLLRGNPRFGSLKPVFLPTSSEKEKISDVLFDREGNLWVYSKKAGLWSANMRFEETTLSETNIQSLAFSRNGDLWVGTSTGLFLKKADLSGHFQTEQEVLADMRLNVICLWPDSCSGSLWIGTYNQGLIHFFPETGKKEVFNEKNGLPNASILSLAGQDNMLWVATLGGLVQIKRACYVEEKSAIHKIWSKADGLPTVFLYKVMVDKKNRLWLATDGAGISCLEGEKFTHYPTAILSEGKSPVPLKTVYSMAEDQVGNIWFNTQFEGILKFDGTTFSRLKYKKGGITRNFTDIRLCKDGNLLISRADGIALLNPETNHAMYFSESSGFKGFSPALNASSTDASGSVWVGGGNTLIQYNTNLTDLALHPATILQGFSVNLQPIHTGRDSVFSYDKNNFVFQYRGLWYTDPQAVRYRYRLLGLDSIWKETRESTLRFPNLPPGKYRFEVSSTENYAWLDEPIESWSFTVESPIWLRWWFLLGAALLLGLVFQAYQKNRDKRLQRLALLEKEKISGELAAIKSQINPHFLFNSFNTLLGLIELEPQKASAFVENMSDFYRAILEYRDKELISLEEELDILDKYCALLHHRFGDAFWVINCISEAELKDVRIIPLSLQLLLENAIKHNVLAKNRQLVVRIWIKDKACIVVENNIQKKKMSEKSTYFGLQSLQKRYKLLSGRQIEVIENDTQFRVELPIL